MVIDTFGYFIDLKNVEKFVDKEMKIFWFKIEQKFLYFICPDEIQFKNWTAVLNLIPSEEISKLLTNPDNSLDQESITEPETENRFTDEVQNTLKGRRKKKFKRFIKLA